MRRNSTSALEHAREFRSTSSSSTRPLDSDSAGIRWLIENEVLTRLEAINVRIQGLERRESANAPDYSQSLRLKDALQILGISKSTLYDRLNPKSPSHDPDFPRPFKLGMSERSPSVWRRSDVVGYLLSCNQLHSKEDKTNVL